MKRIGKMLIGWFLAVVLVLSFVTACGDEPTPSDPDKPANPGSTVTTIYDAMDEDNPRPDYDSMFDYDSGYEPLKPIEPEPVYPKDEGPFTAYRLEAENAEFTIAQYQTAADKLWQNTFTDYHKLGFDLRLSNCLATRNLNEVGSKAKFDFTSDKSLSGVQMNVLVGGYPNKDLTLAGIVNIRVNGKFADTEGITVNESECTQLGHNEYMIFKLVTVPVNLKEGENTVEFESVSRNGGNIDYIEFNTSATISGWDDAHWSDTESVWTVTKEPTIKDTGTLTVTSNVDVGGGTMKDQVQSYTLPALSAENGYKTETNGTATTYSFTLKGEKYSFVHDPDARYTLTLDGSADVSFAGNAKTASLAEGDVLPELTNNTGRIIAGWYNVDDKSETWTSDAFAMPKKNMTVAPYYEAVGQALMPGSAYSYADYFDRLGATDEEKETDEYKAIYDRDLLLKTEDIVGGERGVDLFYDGALADNSYFRLLTRCGSSGTSSGIIANHNYRFWFNVENRSAQAIELELIQVQGGIKMTEAEGAVTTGNITLAANTSTRVSVEIKLTGNNGNAMTVVVIKSAIAESLHLGLSMSKENDVVLNPDVKFDLTLASDTGVTFADDTTSASLAEGQAMPELKNTTGRTVAGWYVVGNESRRFSADAFVMPAENLTLAPYFAKKDGYRDLVPFSEQSTGLPGNCSGVKAENFEANASNRSINDTVVHGGAGEVAELGKLLKCKITMPKDAAFRANTVVNANSAVVKTGVDHKFRFNFENKGTSNVELKMYMVNSGTSIEDGDEGTVISLAPGKSMTVEVTANYKKGSNNKNVMTYFIAQAEMTDLQLGISMSMILGA